MKKIFLLFILAFGMTYLGKGQMLYDDFTGLTAGNLAGQSGWTKGGTGPDPTIANTTPLTYAGYNGGGAEYVVMPAPSGTSSKVYKALGSTPAPGTNTFFYSLLINLSATSAASGNYFITLGDPLAGTTYFARLFAQTSGAGFNIGISKLSNTATYGTTVFNLNQTYLVVVRYDFITGGTNDAVYVWVNPATTSEPSTASAEATISTGTDATPATVGNFLWHNRGALNPVGSFDAVRVGYGATSALAWTDLNAGAGTTAPTIQASNITFSGITTSGMTATWTIGNGAKRIVIMNTSNTFTNPVDGTDPSANTVYGGSGQQVVYNNSGNSVAVTGLLPSTTYWFRVYEYNGAAATTKYLTTPATLNPNSQITASAAVAPSISLPTSATITNTTAVLGGTITADGGSPITERGTVWKTSSPVTIADNKLAEGGTSVATFSHTRTGLPAKTQIYFKAYASNSIGTSLTTEASFYTLANEPTTHVTGFTAVPGGTTSINLTWTAAATGADGYIILQKTGAVAPTGIPADATGYIVGAVLGDGTVAALVTPASTLAKSITGLSPATQYSFTIIPFAWDGVNNATYNYYTAPTIPSASATTTGSGPSTYTWTGANNGLWTTNTNWNPTRFVIASTDILQFNDGTTKTITAVPTETIGQLVMANNTTINLQSAAAVTLTINGLTGTDLVIPAGCALNMNALNAITLAVATAATGSISGNMTFSSTANTGHRLTAADASGITFNSGSVFTAGAFFSGNAFGTGTANSVVFATGSTYIHQAGSNPFVNNPPTSIVVFQTGSLYKLISNSTPSFSGKTYANFEMDATGQTVTVTGGAAVSVDNLTITNGTFNFNMTTASGHSIKGNIQVATGGVLNFAPASSGTVTLNGTALQTISGPGPITTGANSIFEIANSNGVSQNILLTINGQLKLTSGLLTIGTNNLYMGTTATFTGTPSATAMIVATTTGQVQKSYPAGFTGSFIYPVGDNTGTPEYSPVTLNFTGGTFAAGNFAAVNLTNLKYPTDPNFVSYLKRYWNVVPIGITAFTCNATFQYVPADVNGTESQIVACLVNPPPYVAYDLANTGSHQLTASGLNSFGIYTGTQIPPNVVTTAATAIGPTTATLNGTVKANNFATTVNFEYGLTTTYGTVVPGVPATVTGNTVTAVSAAISGLTTNTLYHFRVMGVSLTGTSYGTDMTFTTTCPLPAGAGTVTGPVNVCRPGSGYVYTVPAITWATSYNWTVPPGATITSGGTTNSITVSFPAGSSSGNVSVFGSSVCGNGPASPNLYVTVNAVPVPTITGATPVCVNSGYITYTTESGMTGYNWAVSSGGIINYGSGTYQISVSWIASGAQTVSVNYVTPAGCTAAAPTVKNITVNGLPGPAGTITGIPSVCAGASGFHYSCAVIANATTYVWSLPAGATITSGSGTNQIVVSYSSTAVSGNITVQGNNSCGSGTVSPPYSVIVVQLPGNAGSITGNSSVCEGDAGVAYTVAPITDATGYVWTLPPGAIIVAGVNTNSITVNFPAPSSSGTVTVYGTDFCGNGNVSPDFAVTVKPVPSPPVITATGNTLSSSSATGNQWYWNGAMIIGATGQTYVADQSGNYSCTVISNGCTSAFSNVINIIITGTGNENVAGTISVYPNPSDGQFILKFEGTSVKETTYDMFILNNLGVKIFELDGLKVKGNVRKEIDLRSAPNGIYTLILKSSDENILKKIIINK